MAPSRCPHCNNPLTMEERKGRNCPACGKPLVGGAAEGVMTDAPRPGPIRSEAPYWDRPRTGAEQVLGWGTTRAGLALLATGILITLIGILTLISLVKYEEARLKYLSEHREERPRESLVAFDFFLRLDFIVLLPGGIALCAAGMFMSAAVPSESGAKPWTIGVIFCLVVAGAALLLLLFAALTNREAEIEKMRARFDRPGDEKMLEPPWSKEVLTALRYIYKSALILAGIFFAGFLWGVARHFRRTAAAIALLVYWLLCSAAGITIFILSCYAETTPKIDEIFTKGWVWVWFGVICVFAIWTLINVCVVRAIIGTAMLRRET